MSLRPSVGSLRKDGCLYIGIIVFIQSKIDFFLDMIKSVTHSSGVDIAALHEIKSFDVKQKTDLLRMYFELMAYHRRGSEVKLSRDEGLAAKFINDFFSYWVANKATLQQMYRTMDTAWTVDHTEPETAPYFG